MPDCTVFVVDVEIELVRMDGVVNNMDYLPD